MTRQEQVLRWVNRQRDSDGREPLTALPRGRPGDSMGCTLAHALDEAVVCPQTLDGGGGGAFHYRGEFREFPLPKYVASFARAFDQGRYPDLIEDPS